ncbi:DNA polymerase III subunit gamma/tau [Rhodovibrio salinarum]|uniref:DNA polymerase III subunit gamma/tau n=1 Tax=Rhodovibrio salinarum TaxID=1087 RepID=A0A934QFQ7_9PROT|nr:DNA polymerase III subunit gamma/tau [Rhodovibrio salinarum]MBK1695949.1 DNA polymerase III subunit gamma/tau [Rhodovibrio salinarum]
MSDSHDAAPPADPADGGSGAATSSNVGAPDPYRVLARKYRPETFDDLIGQDALVRTLTNALQAGRMPQAFVLTGVRGVGKTTTARIIARALNCIGPDGQGGPTPRPCGVCEHCTAIAQDRHVDVIEMDAASRTGVDDIRDLIDGVRYRPVTARRKVYIVDEVHMLSKNAFNALLKTLEEPPEHVTFVFATTEIRKVPVTVLSRCMRFDLRRVDQDTLVQHFRNLLTKEGIAAEDQALAMVARAADGSVRDGLSLLDQASALSGGEIGEPVVKDMLGLADRGRVYDLYDAVLGGQAKQALDVLADLYDAGADPAVVLQDLLEVTHTLTRLQVVGAGEALAGLPEVERTRGAEMAKALNPAQLARNWQMLLKGLQETQNAPQPRQAAEMVLLRLVYAGELPTPGELVKQLKGEGGAVSGGGRGGSVGGGGASAGNAGSAQASRSSVEASGGGGTQTRAVQGAGGATAQRQAAPAPEQTPEPADQAQTEATPELPQPQSFQDVVKLASDKRELKLAADLRNAVHLVRFEPGHIEVRPNANAPKDLAGNLGRLLSDWTGRRWVVSLSQDAGDPTLFEQEQQRKAEERARLLQHPKVQAVLETFPGAKLINYTGADGPGSAPAVPDDASDDDGEASAEAPGDDGLDQIDDPDHDGYGDEIDPNDPRFQ